MSDIKWANFQLDVGMASSAFYQMGLDAWTQNDMTLVVRTNDGIIITRQFGAHLEWPVVTGSNIKKIKKAILPQCSKVKKTEVLNKALFIKQNAKIDSKIIE